MQAVVQEWLPNGEPALFGPSRACAVDTSWTMDRLVARSLPLRSAGDDVAPAVFGRGKRHFEALDAQQLLGDSDVVIQGLRVLHPDSPSLHCRWSPGCVDLCPGIKLAVGMKLLCADVRPMRV